MIIDYIKIWQLEDQGTIGNCDNINPFNRTYDGKTFTGTSDKEVKFKIDTKNTVKVKDAATVHWKAGEKIELNPGFLVEEGGEFVAEIKDCRYTPDFATECFEASPRQSDDDTTGVRDDIEVTNLGENGQDSISFDANRANDFIRLYPNPTNSSFNLEFSENYLNSRLEVFNAIGKRLHFTPSINATPFKVDLTNQPYGIYFIKVSNEEKVWVEKVIRQ